MIVRVELANLAVVIEDEAHYTRGIGLRFVLDPTPAIMALMDGAESAYFYAMLLDGSRLKLMQRIDDEGWHRPHPDTEPRQSWYRFSYEQIDAVIRSSESGPALARKYKCSRSMISLIRTGQVYRSVYLRVIKRLAEEAAAGHSSG